MTTHESNAATSRRAARRGDEQDARVVTMLQDLAPQLEVDPDPEYRRAARQRLVAMAAVRTPEPVRPTGLRRLLAARAADAPACRWRTGATAGLAGAALTVAALATLVALSAGAGPGDVLYGVKRGTEQTQLALAGDSRGQTLLDLARTRLEELDDLDGDAGLVRSTLATMDDQTTEGVSWYLARAAESADVATLDRLSSWTTEQSAGLDSVAAEVAPSATGDVAASQGLLGAITQRLDGWRTALDCPDGPAPAGTDQLGPLPGRCRTGGTTPQAPPASTDPVAPVPGAPAPGAPAPGDLTPGALPSGALTPGALTPGAPGGTPPQAVPGTPLEPTAPADPPAGQPAPGPLPPQVPSLPVPSTVPTPPGELDLPGGLPSVPVPSLTAPARPTAGPTTPPTTSSPPPLVGVPLDTEACLQLPLVLRFGKC